MRRRRLNNPRRRDAVPEPEPASEPEPEPEPEPELPRSSLLRRRLNNSQRCARKQPHTYRHQS